MGEVPGPAAKIADEVLGEFHVSAGGGGRWQLRHFYAQAIVRAEI